MANLTFQQLEALVGQAGGTPTQQEYLAGIAAGVESGGNPTAHNPTSTASGLWQELTTTWLGNGGGAYAPTAAQATPLDQAIVAVKQSTGGYQPWAPDFGGAYGASGNAGNPQSPAAGSPVANFLKSIGVTGPGTSPTSAAPAAGATTAYPGGALDPLNIPGEIAGGAASGVEGAILGVLKTITAPLVHFLEDSTLVVFGIILFVVGLVVIAHSVGGDAKSSEDAGTDTTSSKQSTQSSSGQSSTTRTKTVEKVEEPAPKSSSTSSRAAGVSPAGRKAEKIGTPQSGAGGVEADAAEAALA